MLGLPKGEVFLIQWTENWEREFKLEKERIKTLIDEYIVGVHHIGSTAVKHLRAKPIIDIAIELRNFSDGKLCVSPLKLILSNVHKHNKHKYAKAKTEFVNSVLRS